MKINQESTWAKTSMLSKRLNGFLTYTVAAWLALFLPIIIDKVLCKVLNEQFEDGDEK